MSSAVRSFTKIYEISGLNYACTEDWTLYRQICYFLDVLEKVLLLIRLQMTLVHLQASERKYTRTTPKHMKTYESG